MKKIIFTLVLISVLKGISYADIFSKDDTTSPYTIDSAISEDRSGFYYRGGLDYHPNVPPDEPGVG